MDIKNTLRDVKTDTKEAARDADGHQLKDDIGNAGDRLNDDLGKAGDNLRDEADRHGVTDTEYEKASTPRY